MLAHFDWISQRRATKDEVNKTRARLLEKEIIQTRDSRLNKISASALRVEAAYSGVPGGTGGATAEPQ
ncbi:hypothetical protein [uncultured Rikenella sp.]|uniref:hypothetical protein n=1 Tax=uncultured Rikenella sp. TaxID=368003 RepID=UPI0025CD0813|nr:hypothetical protein [uncultured Rikenella sp.]